MKARRILSIPTGAVRSNQLQSTMNDEVHSYRFRWYRAAGVEPVLPLERSSYARTAFNPAWLRTKEDEFDAIHIHGRFDTVPLPNLLAGFNYWKRAKFPVIWSAYDIVPHYGPWNPKRHLARFLLARVADRIVVENEYGAHLLRKLLRSTKEPVRVPCPEWDIDPILKEEAKERLREQRFTYLLFGGLERRKGVDDLLQSFDDSKPDSVLYVIGEITEAQANKPRLIIRKNNVVLKTGFMSEDDLNLHVCAADICVLPFRRACGSGVFFYCQQHGKPMVINEAAKGLRNASGRVTYYAGNGRSLRQALRDARECAGPNEPRTPNTRDPEYQRLASSVYEF